MNDLRFALRQLLKNPGFAAVAVLTLGLGIGANTAIFSVVNAVLLKALPYRQPERMVMLWTDNASLNLGLHELPPTPPDLLDWRRQAQSFEEIAAFRSRVADLSDQGDPERVGGVQATANLFPLLGVQPFLGRNFSAEEEQPGRNKVAVISYRLWQRRFLGDANVIGQLVTINHERCAIVGVMPPDFNFPHGAEMPTGYALMPQTDVWVPYSDTAEYWRTEDTRDFIAMGRFKRGVTAAQAQAEMTAIARREAQASPHSHAGWTIHLRPLALQVAGKARSVLFVLLGAVAFVLLIACVNVANLLLCRAAARRKEMAVRAAIGAGRARIVRQLLTESVLLSLLGGGLGLLFGAWGIRLIVLFSPPNIPRLNETALEPLVLIFTFLISLATGILFGLAPAWQSSSLNLSQALSADGRSGTAAGRHRIHGLLVVAEVAIAVVLLAGAGLMWQSLIRLEAVDPGFNPQRVAAFDISLTGNNYDAIRQRQFYRAAREQLMRIPGVQAAGAISNLPLGGQENIGFFFVEGAPAPDEGQGPTAETRKITPGYFETMGVAVVKGRSFADRDGPDQLKVCIINETIAREFFSTSDPIGKRLKLNGLGKDHPWWTIIGVARDLRSYGLDVIPRPQVYTSIDQNTDNEMTFVVRSDALAVPALERSLRTTMKSLDAGLPMANFRTMQTLVSNALARPRFSAFLLGLFAATALVLTLVGLYGVVAYATSQRTREIGLRFALGASRRDVIALILRQGMGPVLCGLGFGLAGALALTRLLAAQLFEVKAYDPATFLSVAATLILVALAACWLPARRASKFDPMEALRYE